jgi:hypothetical protein
MDESPEICSKAERYRTPSRIPVDGYGAGGAIMISLRDQFYVFGISLLGTMFACWIYFPGCAPLY